MRLVSIRSLKLLRASYNENISFEDSLSRNGITIVYLTVVTDAN